MKYSFSLMSYKGLILCVFIGSLARASVISTPSPSPSSSAAEKQPKIESLLKPQVYERAVKNREIITHAVLDDYTPEPGSRIIPYAAPVTAPSGSPIPHAPEVAVGKKLELKKYSYYSVMLVHATSTRALQVLTNYSLYSKLIPYVQKSDYDPKTQNLEIVGGIFGWTLHSWIHFEEKSSSWIHFEVVAGHFQGMKGEIYFEPMGDSNTLIYLGGSQVLSAWPPKFIIENGEEIVFGFTSNRMRSYIEAPEPVGKTNDGLPQPRSHL
jgi:hypothetical protein